MKYRAGYVSNSSSSSFVVAFPRVPKDANDVKEILFGDSDTFSSPYQDDSWSADMIASRVFEDIEEQESNEFGSIVKSVGGGWFEGSLEYDDMRFKREDGTTDWDKYELANSKLAEEIVLDFMKDNKGSVFYVFEYSDDTSIGSAMEHGDLFDSLSYKKTSYH